MPRRGPVQVLADLRWPDTLMQLLRLLLEVLRGGRRVRARLELVAPGWSSVMAWPARRGTSMGSRRAATRVAPAARSNALKRSIFASAIANISKFAAW